MLLRKQRPEPNFGAILAAAEPFESRGLRMNWIFDAIRQFGAEAARRVVEAAKQCASKSIVAFGIGVDELSPPTRELRPVYDQATAVGLHRLIHAGEIGGPEKIREAVEILGAERIGHGIAAINDPALMHTTLLNEYEHAHQLGMTENELLRLVQMSFDFAFGRENSQTAG